MTNVNVFTIIGRLTADAEEFTIGNNTYVGFRVAVDRGQNKESSFLPVRAPKKFISDNLRAKLIKGAPVLSLAASNLVPMTRMGRRNITLI